MSGVQIGRSKLAAYTLALAGKPEPSYHELLYGRRKDLSLDARALLALAMMETAGELVDDEDLSDAMRGRGLGTPATRAETIEGLYQQSFVEIAHAGLRIRILTHLDDREKGVFARLVITVAAQIDAFDGVIKNARVALGGADTTARRSPEAEAILNNAPFWPVEEKGETLAAQAAAAPSVRNRRSSGGTSSMAVMTSPSTNSPLRLR